jgi:hypothetical protein
MDSLSSSKKFRNRRFYTTVYKKSVMEHVKRIGSDYKPNKRGQDSKILICTPLITGQLGLILQRLMMINTYKYINKAPGRINGRKEEGITE